MQCPECGYSIDELNESQPVCARCGADPNDLSSLLDDPMVQDGLADFYDMQVEAGERALHEKPGNDLIN